MGGGFPAGKRSQPWSPRDLGSHPDLPSTCDPAQALSLSERQSSPVIQGPLYQPYSDSMSLNDRMSRVCPARSTRKDSCHSSAHRAGTLLVSQGHRADGLKASQ